MKADFSRPSRTVFWLLAVLLAAGIAFGLRYRAALMLPIDYDEDDYLRAGQHYASALVSADTTEITRYAYNLEHPPLVKLAYGAVLSYLPAVDEIPQMPVSAPPAASLPQPHLRAARLTSAVFGTLQVLLLALLNPLAGIFLSVHTFTIKYTSQVMLEALPALTSLLAITAYARSRGRLNVWLLLSALFLGLTAAGKYLYAVVGIAIMLHWLIEIRESGGQSSKIRSLGLMAGWGLLSLLFFFATDPFLWPDPVGRLLESLTYNFNYSTGQQVQSAGLPFWQPLAYLTSSVPWHPGVFLVSIDGPIAALAAVGFCRLWREKRVFALWLLVGLFFLLLWPTKWPQYILVVTAPLSLSAAYGAKLAVWQPLKALFAWLRSPHPRPEPRQRTNSRQELRKALPWLALGLITLSVITLFPLLFQAAMALTNFSAPAIRDGMRGGVWRAIFQGLTGQESAVFYPAFSGPASGMQVKFAGLSLLSTLISSIGSSVLLFEILWTVLAVATQTALGVGLALLLHRRGVGLKNFWRALFILPWAVPEFVSALTWSQLFDPRFGALTLAGRTWSRTPGFIPPGAAANPNPDTILISLLISALWYGFPLMLLAASAGLKALPPEVMDAAALDGANAWQTGRQIILPMLMPLLAPAIILRAIFAFNQFYLFTVFQPPYPMLTLSAISYYFFSSFQGGQYALSAAINILTVVFLLVLILGFNKVSRAAEGVTYA